MDVCATLTISQSRSSDERCCIELDPTLGKSMFRPAAHELERSNLVCEL